MDATSPPASRAKIIVAWVIGGATLALGARVLATSQRPAAGVPAHAWAPTAAGSAAALAPGDVVQPTYVKDPPGGVGTFQQFFPQITPTTSHPIGLELRPMDRAIFDKLAAGGLTDAELHDVFPKEPYKVEFSRKAGRGIVDRARIDLTRSGRTDETWTIDIGSVDRTEIRPNDPPVPYALRDGRWLPH